MSERTQDPPRPPQEQEPGGGPPEPRHVLVRTAVLAGLTRLVPVPFLDDFLLVRARRHQVHALLDLHGRGCAKGELAALSSDPGSCLCGLVGFVLLLPLKLLVAVLKKLFQTVFFVLAIRAAALTVASTFLLGRTVHQELAGGGFADGTPPPERVREAHQVREAFEATFKGSDWRLLVHAIKSAWSGAGGLLRGGGEVARHGFEDDDDAAVELTQEEEARVDALAQRVEAALENEQVRGYLEDFDRRYRQTLAEVRARPR
ncbi:MAG: hypothetical protein R3F62_06020 [Planctomycetota bacterium]